MGKPESRKLNEEGYEGIWINDRGKKVHDGYDGFDSERYKKYAAWKKDDIVDSVHQTIPTHDVRGIIKLTAETLDVPPKLVKLCINNTFHELKEWLRNPDTCAAVMINDFGTFYINLRSINMRIINLIPFLRGRQREKYIDQFRELWRRRQLAIDYELRRKSTKRRLIFEKDKNK